VGQYGTASSLRYDGASPVKALSERRRILNVILDFMGASAEQPLGSSYWSNLNS